MEQTPAPAAPLFATCAITTRLMNSAWIAYAIHVATSETTFECIYIGACMLNEIGTIPDARRNTAFRDSIKPDTKIIITALDLADTREAAQAIAARTIESRTWSRTVPYCNEVGKEHIPGTRPVRHTGTGEVFRNARAAALAYSITPQQMSAHLAGKAGYRTVKGQQFVRVDDADNTGASA